MYETHGISASVDVRMVLNLVTTLTYNKNCLVIRHEILLVTVEDIIIDVPMTMISI